MPTDRSVKVRLGLDPKGFIAGTRAASMALNDLRKDIDKTNDRTAWLAQSFLALGPSLGPLATVGAAGLAGLATQMTATAAGAAVFTMAMNGIGDALGALNDYQIDPTEAHLKAMHRAMAFIGPTGRDLVRVLDEMRNGFIGLSNLSRDKMFPGVIDGLEELRTLAPQVEQIVAKTASVLGDMVSDAGEGLAGPKFAEFFDFLEGDALRILDEMGRIVGNLADGFAAMLVAFLPLSRDFSGGMLEMSRSFAEWAHGLSDNASFQEFIDYVREQTPHVLDLFGQMVETLIAIGEAAAPVGGIMIPVLTGILEIIQAIVDSPLGPIFFTAAAMMSLYGRAAALADVTTGKLLGKVTATAFGFDGLKASVQRTGAEFTVADAKARRLAASLGTTQLAASKTSGMFGGFAKALGPAAVTMGTFAVANSDVADKVGLSHAAWGAFMGSLGGPAGAAIGGAIGGAYDLTAAYFKLATSTEEFVNDSDGLAATLDQQTGAITANTEAFVENELAKQGVLAAAKEVGVASQTLIDAYLGDELAIYRVEQALSAGLNPALLDEMGRSTLSAEASQKHREALELVTSALGGGVVALDEARDGMVLTGEEVDTTREKFTKATEELNTFTDSLDTLDARLEKRGNWAAYQSAIDALGKGFREDENGTTLDWGSEKGRANNSNLNTFAQSVKEVAATLSGQARVEFLKGAMAQFDRLIEKTDLSDKQVRHLKENLGLLGLKDATPTVKVGGVDMATSKVDSLERGLLNLDGLTVHPKVIVGIARDTGNNFGSGPGYAEGGFTGPGAKYEPAGIVHRGEFVFDAETTKRNIDLFQAIHNGAPGYANGGYVAATAQPSAAAGIDYERLGVVIARNSRQMFGETHFHQSGDYDRAKQDALAAKGGG